MGEPKQAAHTGPDQRETCPLVTQILSMVLGFTGFVLSAVAISGCNFFEISTFWIYGSVSVGVFEYELVIVDGLLSIVNGYGDIEDITIRSVGCKAYPGNPPKVDSFLNVTTPYQAADLLSSEGSFKAAKAFGFLSALISGLAMITCFLMLFLKLPRWAFKTVAGCYLFCFFSQLLTFLVLDNPVCKGGVNSEVLALQNDLDLGINCSLGSNAYAAIFASIFFLALGITMFVCPTPKVHVISKANWDDPICSCCHGDKKTSGNHSDRVSPQHVDVRTHQYSDDGECEMSMMTEIFNPDGSITIKEEKENPDGTKCTIVTTKRANRVVEV